MIRKKVGVVYIALGRFYLSMALLSAKTLRRSNPNLQIAVITNEADSLDDLGNSGRHIDEVISVPFPTEYNRSLKTSLISFTPFEKTLYLDCDTLVIGDISLFSAFLDHFDLCFRLNQGRQQAHKKGELTILGGAYRVSELPHWNSGVFGFKKNARVQDFFDRWGGALSQLNSPFDQPALVEALFRSSARLLSLPDEWNSLTDSVLPKNDSSNLRIIHYTNRISSVIAKELKVIYSEAGWDSLDLMLNVRQRRMARRNKIGKLAYLGLRSRWIIDYFLSDSRLDSLVRS